MIKTITTKPLRRLFAIAASILLLTTHNYAASPSDQQKLEAIQTAFADNAAYSQLWQYGWSGLYAGSLAVKGGLWAQSGSHKERYDNGVGFITTSLGLGDLLLNPLRTHSYAKQIKNEEIELKQAEEWLAAAAAEEQEKRSWWAHVSALLVNSAAGLTIALEDDRKTDGAMLFLTNMIATETKIFTSPKQMTKAYEAYQDDDLAGMQTNLQQPSSSWQVAAAGPVLYLNYRF